MRLERHAEPVGQHLGERRGVALAVIERAGRNVTRRQPRTASPPSPCGRRGDLEEAADADPAQPAAGGALLLAPCKSGRVGQRQGMIDTAGKSPLS